MPSAGHVNAARLHGMRTLALDIADLGLFAKRADLRSNGWTDRDLRSAVNQETIDRVRKGWYSVPTAPPMSVEAFRIGGRLAGLSSLRSWGIWTPETRKIHVTVPGDARGLRRPGDMRTPFDPADRTRYRVTWNDAGSNRHPSSRWRTSIIDALVHVLENHDRVTSIVCLDAALHNRQEGGAGIELSDLDEIFARAPGRVRHWRAQVDGRAGAGGETEFRLRALDAGIPFVPQPFVKGVGFLDGQIGPSVFVEVDGAEWHDNPEAFEVDRERDALVAGMRGRVLRFSYHLYRRNWPLCERAMVTTLDEDYRLAKQTVFPAFPWRLQQRPATRTRSRPTRGVSVR